MLRLLPVLALVAVSALPAPAVPTTTHEGDVWTLSNDALSVAIDAKAGTFQVLDKRSGYLWKGPDGPSLQSVELLVRQATAAPTVDGVLAEWSDDDVVAITPNMVADARKVDGAEDLSAGLRVRWDAAGLYLGIDVSDEALMPPSAEETEWWYKDSVEFWVGGDQYAIRAGEWGSNVWTAAGVAQDVKAAYKPRQGGYVMEALIPTARLGEGGKKGLGGRLRFALGINDCDGADGRQGQLYYPIGWRHSSPETFALATLVGADGRPVSAEPAQPQQALVPVDEGKTGEASFGASVRSSSARVPATLSFALDGDSPDLLITATADDAEAKTGRFDILHPLMLDRPNGRILAARYCNGIGVPTDDLTWRGQSWSTFGSLDMPWVGLTDGEIGYLLLWELPVSCDNGIARVDMGSVGGEDLLAPGVSHDPIKGTFGAPRTVRYSFCAEGGHVAICKRYRKYAEDNGFLVTQNQKMLSKPSISRLAGAPDIWGRSDLAFCRQAKAAGMERLIVNGGQSKEDMLKIAELGYLTSVYDNYEDMFEGDKGLYGDCKTERDAVVKADGSLMKAWLTKGDPPKQFMKRCTALFEPVARKWIPLDLEKHPYNARFLDVTTACGMIECYSEAHGLDRTADRAARVRLARYVSEELGLVLGGEHGRWWGVPHYDYWEGMQSGGFYSWPAGHVGLELPKTREEIGKQYLAWGLGEKNRYPLWELVFHDCVVSTWYWGDSTGHLASVAPELGYKQDAFNVLYGTIPLYWVNRPYSYNWDLPETRQRLLESYRNTCKLHEKVAFDELVSHEFVTEDRAVQRSEFSDGTQCWVNLGDGTKSLEIAGETYSLPAYGFYVKGPEIEQYRIQKTWEQTAYKGLDEDTLKLGGVGGDRTVTCIRTDEYLAVQGDVPGLVESHEGRAVTLQRGAEGEVKVTLAPGTTWARLDPRAVCPDAPEGTWLAVLSDREGTPTRLQPMTAAEGGMLTLREPAATAGNVTLLSPLAMAQRAEPALVGECRIAPESLSQGAPAQVTVSIANYGGIPAEGVSLAVYAGAPAQESLLGRPTVAVAAGGTATVTLPLQTEKLDGQVRLALVLDEDNAIEEVCEADNRASLAMWVEPDLARWDSSLDVSVDPGELSRTDAIVAMPLDASAERVKLGKAGEADPTSLRVVRLGEGPLRERMLPCQYKTEDEQGPQLLWQVPGAMAPGAVTPCRVYLDGAEAGRHAGPTVGRWDAANMVYEGTKYRVVFRDGYIRSVALRRPGGLFEVIKSLGVSSQDTGWVDEVGDVQSFEVVTDGPVLTQVRVEKSLRGNHSYDKLYSFYPEHFVVTTLSPERFGTLSRAFYGAACRYQDDKGNVADIDGKGDAEGISGKNGKPKWFATWADDWALVGVPLTAHDNVGYWDAGSWAGLGFTTGDPEPASVGYYIHLGSEGQKVDGPGLAADDYARVQSPVVVKR